MKLRTLLPILLAAVVGTGCCTGCSWLSDEPKPPPPIVAPLSHQVTTAWMPSTVTRFAPQIDAASRRHGVDANLLAIVMLVESGGDPYARGPAGERGLMQLTPALASHIATQRGLITHNPLRLVEPGYNLDLAAWHLAQLLQRFYTAHPDHNVDRAAAAYHGGPELVARGGVLPPLTRTYMQWVGGMWRERFQPRSPMFERWYQAGGKVLVDRASTSPVPPLLPPVPLGVGESDGG